MSAKTLAQMQDDARKVSEQETVGGVLLALEALGGAFTAEDMIDRDGSRFAVPAGMSLSAAAAWLAERAEAEEERTIKTRTFNYRPWDGAHATHSVMRRIFGAVTHQGQQGFFGRTPPEMNDVPSGPGQTTAVPWGSLSIPMLPEVEFVLGQQRSPEHGLIFQLSAVGPKKYGGHVEGIFALVAEQLAASSLYRGKSFNGATMPAFLDPDSINPARFVFAADTMRQVEASVWAAIKYTDAVEAAGMPIKRAVLLEGPYGTGKSSLGLLTAKVANDHEWSYIHVRPGEDDVGEALRTARLYEPCVVFVEDVDTFADPTGSDAGGVSRLLDMFDGLTSKSSRVLVVMTTNHADRIHAGMIRPGRLDAMIHIGKPDAAGYRSLVEQNVRPDLLAVAETDWANVVQSLDGYLPAFVVEAAGRAVRYSLARAAGDLAAVLVTGADVIDAANGLRGQWDAMNAAPEHSQAPSLDAAFRQLLASTVETIDGVAGQVEQALGDVAEQAGQRAAEAAAGEAEQLADDVRSSAYEGASDGVRDNT